MGVIPYFDCPIGTRGNEYFGMEMVPFDRVNSHMMSLEKKMLCQCYLNIW